MRLLEHNNSLKHKTYSNVNRHCSEHGCVPGANVSPSFLGYFEGEILICLSLDSASRFRSEGVVELDAYIGKTICNHLYLVALFIRVNIVEQNHAYLMRNIQI